MLRHFSVLAREGTLQVQARVLPEKLAQTTTSSTTDVAEKIKRAVLYEELNATNRRLVFRPTKAHLVNQFDLPKHKGQPLEPTKYLGVPSRANYSEFIAQCETPDEVLCALTTIEACAQHKTTARNVLPAHLAALLRKSAEFGIYEQVYQFLTVRELFKSLMTMEVYLEALRIVALRVPSKSRDVKGLLLRLYTKCPEDSRREAGLLYGLSQLEHADTQIQECLGRIDGLEVLEPVDLALLKVAGEKLGKKFDFESEGDEVVVYSVKV